MTKSAIPGTAQIGIRAATNVFHGVRFAAAHHRPMNLLVSINWDRLDISADAATGHFRKLRQKVRRRWTHLSKTRLSRLGPFIDAGAHENPDGCRNTHWLIHVPPFFSSEFKKDVVRFLKKVVGQPEIGKAAHFRAVRAAGGVAKYLTKGVDPQFGDYFHMRTSDQGFIPGRGRTFVSRAIGFTERKRLGWKRKPDSAVSSTDPVDPQ